MFTSNFRKAMLGSSSALNGPAVFGSTRASTFIKDLQTGTDSLDVLVIGDSNGGQNEYGYTGGTDNALRSALSIQPYSTPLQPGGRFWGASSNFPAGIIFEGMIGVGLYDYGSDDNTAGGAGSTTSLRLMVRCPTDTGNDALKSYLAFDSTNSNITSGTMLIQPNRFMWDPSVVPTDGFYGSPTGTTNLLRINTNSAIVSQARSARYRVVHGTYATGTGQFKLLISNGFTTNYAVGSYVSTNTGSTGYATASLAYSTPATPVNSLWCTWDGGYNASANSRLVKGPCAILWHSFSVTAKGYSVTNLTTSSGRSTTQLADRVEGMDKVLDSALKELRERQVLAGGTGRVLVFCNSGVNGAETGATYTNAIARIRDRVAARWVATGGTANQLAFVFSLTAELNPSYTGSGSSWISSRPAVSTTANAYAVTNAGDGNGVSIVDTSIGAGYAYLTSNSYYGNTISDQIHLTNSGYNAVSLVIANALLNA